MSFLRPLAIKYVRGLLSILSGVLVMGGRFYGTRPTHYDLGLWQEQNETTTKF